MNCNRFKGTLPSGGPIEGDALTCRYSKRAENWRPSRERTWHSSHQPWALLLNCRLLRVELVTGPERPYAKDPGDGCHPPAKGLTLNPDALARGATTPRLPADHPLTLRSGVILKRCSDMVTILHAIHLAQGVRAPTWGASTARLILRAEALVCHGSQNS